MSARVPIHYNTLPVDTDDRRLPDKKKKKKTPLKRINICIDNVRLKKKN